MSDLLNSASLVMIPSGYKEDVVYSQIPTDGSGDLSFTRASNGTRVNSAGLVEVTPWNLLQYSENFTSGWITVNSSITANSTTAPNGTTTADTFTVTASSDSSIYQPVNGSTNNYSVSIYAKYVSGDKYLYIFSPLNSQSAKVWFDIQNGTVSNQSSGFTGTIENAGNGWYRCSLYNTNQAVLDYIQLGISTTNSSRILSNNSVSYIWGAQVNLGTLKPYFPTTDRLNVPRLTYQNGGGGCPSLLLEKQSTNLLTYSEQFDNSAWLKDPGIVITPNATISPDGTQNADLADYQGNSLSMYRYPGTIGVEYNMSIYVKAYSGYSGKKIGLVNGPSSLPVTLTDEWQRVNLTGTILTPNIEIYNRVEYQPIKFYIWGAQYEASSYPTSYIPTTSSSATRVADACYKTGISSLIGQTEGTIFVDVDLTQSNSTGANQYLMQIYEAGSQRILLYRTSANQLAYYFLNGSTIFNHPSSVTTNGRHKLAFAYKSGDSAFYIDGVQIQTNATTFSAFTALAELHLGMNYNGAIQAEICDSKYNEPILFKTRLTNAELASLTTI